MTADLRVLGIAGSLRERSFNRALLRAAQELVPEGMTIEIAEIGAIPLYNGDVEAVGLPEPVIALREKIRSADGLLVVTPEYNYSIPGVLKNTIDWMSRPPDQPLNNKPLAIMAASNGMRGGVRSQLHLRHVAMMVNMHVLNKPEVLVDNVAQKFDADLHLTDATTGDWVRQELQAFAAWIERLR